MKTTESINRSELIKKPGSFGINLGKNPTSRLALYERWGLIPTSIKVGGSGQGIGRKAFYPAVVLQMIEEIQAFQKDKTFENIRELLNEKYSPVYEMYDVLSLMQLRFRSNDLLAYYLGESSLDSSVQSRLVALIDKTSDLKDLKLGMLNLLKLFMTKTDKKLKR
jgi:hypothetical protein